jgi:hypothetical protein
VLSVREGFLSSSGGAADFHRIPRRTVCPVGYPAWNEKKLITFVSQNQNRNGKKETQGNETAKAIEKERNHSTHSKPFQYLSQRNNEL